MEVGEQVAAQQQQQTSDESSGGNGSLPKGHNPTTTLELSATTSASKLTDNANGQPLVGMNRPDSFQIELSFLSKLRLL